MGSSLIVLAVGGGAVAAIALLVYAFWEKVSHRLERFGLAFKRELDVGGVNVRPEAFGSTLLALGVAGWAVLLLLTQPALWGGLFELLAAALVMLTGGKLFLRFRVARTARRFTDQLEGTLRQLAGAVRVGLGLRQALIDVAEQSDEPTRRELTRIVGATNLGVSFANALEDLADRIRTQETVILTRVLRVQTRTGGDLAAILEGLADTIRDRRRFGRRVSALTAQGRASAWIIGALPVAIFAFMCVTQPDMREASLGTQSGRVLLGMALGLDGLAALVLMGITRIDA